MSKDKIAAEIASLERARHILAREWRPQCKPHDFLMSCAECRARVALRCIDETLEFHREDLKR